MNLIEEVQSRLLTRVPNVVITMPDRPLGEDQGWWFLGVAQGEKGMLVAWQKGQDFAFTYHDGWEEEFANPNQCDEVVPAADLDRVIERVVEILS